MKKKLNLNQLGHLLYFVKFMNYEEWLGEQNSYFN